VTKIKEATAKGMLLAGCGLWAMALNLLGASTSGKVLWKEGRVEERIAGRVRSLDKGDAVVAGGEIQTGSEGTALLELFPGSFVLVRPESELLVKTLASDRLGESQILFDQASLELRRGELFTNVRKVEGRETAFVVEGAGKRIFVQKGLYSVTRREGRLALVVGRDSVAWQAPGESERFFEAGQWIFAEENGQNLRTGSIQLWKNPSVRLVSLQDLQTQLTGLQGWMVLLGSFDQVSTAFGAGSGSAGPLAASWNSTASALQKLGDPPDPQILLPPGIAQLLIALLEQILALFPPNSPEAQVINQIIQSISPH
jgi:hypothetical protein